MQMMVRVILAITLATPVAAGEGRTAPARTQMDQRFFSPATVAEQPENGRWRAETLDIENSSYVFGRYEKSSDLPNPYSGSLGRRIRVEMGETVTRDNVAVGFYACCRAPQREQIWEYKIFGPDASGNPTVLLMNATAHQTTDQYNRPCWDGMFCGATSVDYFPWLDIDCSLTLGNYKAQVVYQGWNYSTWSLNPPAVVFERTFKLGPRKDALSVNVSRTQLRAGITHGKMFGSQQRPEGEKAKVRVSAYDCGPLTGRSVTIKREWLPDSGGHLHILSGDDSPPLDDVAKLTSASGVTNASGIYETDIQGMNIAGHLKITAESSSIVSGQIVKSQPFGLHVGFDGLVNLAPLDEPDIAGYLSLFGHNNANCTGTDCDNHRDQSHHAAPQMLPFLLEMAVQYNDQVGPAIIRVNDISLPDGGVFETRGNWTPGEHWYHRIGCGVDIEKTGINPNTGAVDVVLNITKLTKIVESLGGFKVIEGPVHYELPAAIQDEVLAGANYPYVKAGETK